MLINNMQLFLDSTQSNLDFELSFPEIHEVLKDNIKFKVFQNFELEIHVQKAVFLSIFDGFQQMRAQNLS